MRRKIFVFGVLLALCGFALAGLTCGLAEAGEAPGIEWAKSLGGSGDDGASAIQRMSDGGYIVAGWTKSSDGDVSGHHGGADVWVVKLDATGEKEWDKSLGGSGNDAAYAIQQTSDGGYIVAGDTESTGGDVSGHHGDSDAWVVKLDAAGNKEWAKSLGGSNYDSASAIIQRMSDGGYIVAGVTWSSDGDMSGNSHGGGDALVVKLDAAGEKEWDKSLGGGSGYDFANAIQQTSDGGYIVAGSTSSTDGDVSGNHGGYDAWVVKLDANGDIDWQKSLGGSNDDYAYAIQQTPDGGYIVAGNTESTDGDVSGHHGGSDAWVVKLDANGEIDWQKSHGGSGEDDARAIQQTSDGGYIAAGYTNSTDGDVSGNHGNGDAWIVKLSAPPTVADDVNDDVVDDVADDVADDVIGGGSSGGGCSAGLGGLGLIILTGFLALKKRRA